jgi:hypothetical protein
MQEIVEMRSIIRRLLCLSIAALLLSSCKIPSDEDNRNSTSTPTALIKTPVEPDPTLFPMSTKEVQGARTRSATGTESQSGCAHEGSENGTESPDNLSYLLYCSVEDEDINECSILNMLQNETYSLPDDLIPLGWSPTGDRLLLADVNGPSVYTTDRLGRNPTEVFSVESDQVENDWGWWLSENEIIIAGRTSDGAGTTWQYYLVNLESGSSVAFDPNETWQIYDVATNGGFWIEGWEEVEIVYTDHSRTPLWDKGDVKADITPNISYLSIYPDNCGIVFIGCTGDRTQGDRSCSIYNEVLNSEGKSSVVPLYLLGDAVYAYSLEVSPDSRYLAFVDYWMNLIVIDLSDGTLAYKRTLPFTSRATPHIVWGPDSNNIAIDIDTTEEGHVIIFQSVLTDPMSVINPGPGSRLVEWRSFSK